ncbi:MAG: hypothetical protein IJI66_13615 [Erysipelotrichaceae bacterium]|nr:hypothetical protein [Erysipelotrichaceae bacterium]
MNPEQIFDYEGEFCRVISKDGETVKGIIRLVSYQGEDVPDENFIIIGRNGIPFDDIDSIDEIDNPSEPDVLIDELWSFYNDQKRVDEIFDKLDAFLKEEHPEEEKQIIKDFYNKHVISE